MLEQIEILLKTINVNLMMHREIGTIGYKLKALEAFRKIEVIVENEEEVTGEYNLLEFKKVV